MARFTDALITNNQAGKAYLIEAVRAQEDIVFAQPYLVPEVKALAQNSEDTSLRALSLQHPIFIFIGKIIPRKGLRQLLETCSILKRQGYQNYTLLIVGDGWQRQELEKFSKTRKLEAQVQWVGAIEYGCLGAYLSHADVFVFPTLEDVWGMVLPEAMAFGKPVLCSKWAGAAELVVEGANGYCFDPHEPERLAELMCRFINNPALAVSMGRQSQQLMSRYTPATAANFLAQVISFVYE
jgi:glycosyltransferase involved in cell wall biosynthesis